MVSRFRFSCWIVITRLQVSKLLIQARRVARRGRCSTVGSYVIRIRFAASLRLTRGRYVIGLVPSDRNLRAFDCGGGGPSKICRRIPSTGAAHYKATARILYCFAKITPQKPSSPLEPNHNQYHMSCGNFACRDRFKVTSQVRAEASSMHGGETLQPKICWRQI